MPARATEREHRIAGDEVRPRLPASELLLRDELGDLPGLRDLLGLLAVGTSKE